MYVCIIQEILLVKSGIIFGAYDLKCYIVVPYISCTLRYKNLSQVTKLDYK